MSPRSTTIFLKTLYAVSGEILKNSLSYAPVGEHLSGVQRTVNKIDDVVYAFFNLKGVFNFVDCIAAVYCWGC